MEWPLVTLPDFPMRGLAARQQMKAEVIGFLPLVSEEDRDAWEAYSVESQGWVDYAKSWESAEDPTTEADTRKLQQRSTIVADTRQRNGNRNLEEQADFSKGVSNSIFRVTTDGLAVVDNGAGPFTPIWMTSPAPPTLSNINFNLLSHQYLWQEVEVAVESEQAVISQILNLKSVHQSMTSSSMSFVEPISSIYYPIFDNYASDRKLVGILASELGWKYFFEGALPNMAQGVVCVIENSCQQAFTYRVYGTEAIYMGPGDLHDTSYDEMVESRSMSFLVSANEGLSGVGVNFEPCPFSLKMYPSESLEASFDENTALVGVLSILTLFFISGAVFFLYDTLGRRGESGDASVVKIERLFHEGEEKQGLGVGNRIRNTIQKGGLNYTPSSAPAHFKATIQSLPSLLRKGSDESFPEATVLFADIYGLDAWSVGKEPEERSSLVESVYHKIHTVGKKYHISQVEITGDSFVAIHTGSGKGDDHAIELVSFACECRKRVIDLFKGMRVKGLAIRFGIHSGHVQTGGYGDENAKYQLFGDTVDTTYQMLSSSRAGKIHISVETAELLNLAGKGNWLAPRSDLVLVQGKGEMSTFWIKPKTCLTDNDNNKDSVSVSDSSTAGTETSFDDVDAWESVNLAVSESQETKFQHVVDRLVDILYSSLKKIQAKRNASRKVGYRQTQGQDASLTMGTPIVEEARDAVRMPSFDSRVASLMVHGDSGIVDVPEEAKAQLRLYVSSIASTYRANEFHNVEHAAHVTLTMEKMIKKLVSPEAQDVFVDFGGRARSAEAISFDLDCRTYGISSDPLSQFALLLACLVHDVDHVGVSNSQLVKEGTPIASLYRNQSVAEQNSVDIAWWLLMTPNFTALREAIYTDDTEMQRFRQILVNTIIATDIMDRPMKVHRDKCWKKAFDKGRRELTASELKDLQATLVMEHIMQAADHGHTMQSFGTYVKWSQRLFDELYQAYHSGRAEKDPALSWFVGELAFFDKFIIPLATRLKDSGAFGSAGEEYLTNALQNRKLWATKGKDIVDEMKEKFSRKVVLGQEDTVVFT